MTNTRGEQVEVIHRAHAYKERAEVAEAAVARAEALADKWDSTRCGVLSPGLRRAADDLRAVLPERPRQGHFVGGLVTDESPGGLRFIEAPSTRTGDSDA